MGIKRILPLLKILSIILTIVMCLSLASLVFASEVPVNQLPTVSPALESVAPANQFPTNRAWDGPPLNPGIELFANASIYVAPVTEDVGLDELTKQEYYAEYIEIAKEVSKETELDIVVLPMSEFKEKDWRTPEEFQKYITEVANWRLICNEVGIQPYSTATATKSAKVIAGGDTHSIDITGSFKTQLNASTGRQHFAGINYISSRMSGSVGTWKQTGYEYEIIDGARTYAIHVSGELTIAGVKFLNKLAYVEFYCSATGLVS